MPQKNIPFIGRKEELSALKQLLSNRIANLVVIKGRRRIGKSRLVREFAEGLRFYEFSALAPTPATTAQSQRDEFAKQLGRAFNLEGIRADDWTTLFNLLAKETQKGRVVILLDEISWMGSLDSDFKGKLKNAWDLAFKHNSELILILCGSVSSWIEKNIINDTGFVGRPTLYLTLNELSLPECNQFWPNKNISNYDKFKFLSVSGGIPRYLEFIDTNLPTEALLQNLCFKSTGVLVHEFKQIFTDIFQRRSNSYQKILGTFSDGIKERSEIARILNITETGDLTNYLEDLVLAGFIARDYTWHIKTGKISKLSHFRLKDNYVRFYLKYILPNHAKIEKGLFNQKLISKLPGWDVIMGLQFENLVINNHNPLLNCLKIYPEQVVFANPFFQPQTNRQPGCQIDYLIQTESYGVYICEIKFSKQLIGHEIITAMQKKINNLRLPKHCSFHPVLIHVNGVNEDVIDANYFHHIVDFGELLQ